MKWIKVQTNFSTESTPAKATALGASESPSRSSDPLEQHLDLPTETLASRQCFITGSRAYGTPSVSSDLDLVAYIPCYKTVRELERLSDSLTSYDGCSKSLRFGKLNLIVCTTEEQLEEWQSGTQQLIQMSKHGPVLRDAAVNLFKWVRELFTTQRQMRAEEKAREATELPF